MNTSHPSVTSHQRPDGTWSARITFRPGIEALGNTREEAERLARQDYFAIRNREQRQEQRRHRPLGFVSTAKG